MATAMGQRLYGQMIRSSRWLIVAILLLAAGLRIWGLAFGLPHIYHPDEVNGVWRPLQMLQTGDLNPHFFHWPSLVFYVNAALFGLQYIVGNLMGIFDSPADLPSPIMVNMAVGRMPMPGFWLVSRVLVMGFGLGTVVLAYLCGKKLTGRKAVGLLAAFMLSLSPTLVVHSRFIAPDGLTIFFLLLAFYGAVGVLKEGKTRYYVLAGLSIGLTASTKYNGASVAVTLLVSHLLRYGFRGFQRPHIYGAFIISIAAFVATTPYAILDYGTFLTDLRFDAQHYSTGHAGMEGESLKWYLNYLWTVEGPFVLLALAGVILVVLKRSKELVLLGVFSPLYFIFISSFVVRNARTIMPILPLLFLLAAVTLIHAAEAIQHQPSGWRRSVVIALFAGFALSSTVLPLRRTIAGSVRNTTVDSRETARLWIAGSIPVGSHIALEPYSPFIDPDLYRVTAISSVADQDVTWYRENHIQYLIMSEGAFGRFFQEPEKYQEFIASYERILADLQLVKFFNDGGYEVRIYAVPQE